MKNLIENLKEKKTTFVGLLLTVLNVFVIIGALQAEDVEVIASSANGLFEALFLGASSISGLVLIFKAKWGKTEK